MLKHILHMLLVLFLASSLPAMDISVNKSIAIRDGKNKRGGMTTVNGNLSIGSNCRVTGTLRTVNGNIDVGDNSTIKKLQTVNGGITIDRDTKVLSNIQTVNGFISCNSGVQIMGNIQTINAIIELDNTHVKRNITTYTGNINLHNGSVVERNILVKHNSHNENNGCNNKVLKIILDGNSVIKGDIIVNNTDIEVVVYLRNGSKIMGDVENAQVINE